MSFKTFVFIMICLSTLNFIFGDSLEAIWCLLTVVVAEKL